MRKKLLETALFAFSLVVTTSAFAADDNKEADAPPDKDAKAAKKDEVPIPKEKTSVTHGSVDVGGRSIHYTATAGNVLIRDDKNEPNASVFYVA